jgi:hypothetical protein
MFVDLGTSSISLSKYFPWDQKIGNGEFQVRGCDFVHLKRRCPAHVFRFEFKLLITSYAFCIVQRATAQ